MNATLEQIKPETIARLEKQAKVLRLSVDEYLLSLLPKNENDLGLKVDNDIEFEADMNLLADETDELLEYNGTYSREDIYFDHD